MDLGDVASLVSDQGRYLLERLASRSEAYSSQGALALAEGLRRRGVDPRLAAAALTQLRLRQAAEPKFGEFAQHMLFTDQGLAQATRLVVAAHHARRYLAAGATHVADLTGGIGGDALALAALGLRVTVFERDPLTAAIARANLAAFPEARIVTADSLEADLTSADALWADPSRRAANGRRIFDPAAWDPPLARLLPLATDRPLGIKAAPGLPHSAIPPGAEAEWVSADGAVVEVALWFGSLRQLPPPGSAPPPHPPAQPGTFPPGSAAPPHPPAQPDTPTPDAAAPPNPPAQPGSAQPPHPPAPPGTPTPDAAIPPAAAHGLTRPPGARAGTAARSALVIRDGAAHHLVEDSVPPLPTGTLGAYLYEPDGAVIRAGLLQQAAAPLADARLVHPKIAYITAGQLVQDSPFLTAYSVEDSFPFSLKRLQAYLRRHGIGQLIVKKRGTAVDPADLLKRLDLRGEGKMVVILTRLGAQQSVLVVRPLAGTGESGE
ncbi:MAG: class I SAM-dependent methyltransferase [Bifidobacteriaceae bacterium]|nr:class I SAM-dependent methyltransferase [Bifidobacteriaceae bacterium]